MSIFAARFVARLVAIEVAVWVIAGSLVLAFAPRLLLLSNPVMNASATLLFWLFIVNAVVGEITTVLLTRKLWPTIQALTDASWVTTRHDLPKVDQASPEVDPKDLLAIYALPARIVGSHLVIAFDTSMATVLPFFRPHANDVTTEFSLILLVLTMVSATTLPLYVMLRSNVSRMLELAPASAARAAMELVEELPHNVPRVRARFLAAVTAPVIFVALGASLLVYAHARVNDAALRRKTAIDFAAGVFDLVKDSSRGRDEAALVGDRVGYRSEIFHGPVPPKSDEDDAANNTVTVPLEDGYAVVHYGEARVSPVIGVYALVAFVAAACAAFLGSRIGGLFTEDLWLATQGVRQTGVADVIRGLRLVQPPRFLSVSALLRSVDDLGTVFREFAGAQRGAINAREGTERMRALFLASMSHDLKAPLNAILGFAAIVSRNRLSAGQEESLAIIEQRGRELLSLIQTILDSARVEAGALEITSEWTLMADVVTSAVLDIRDLGLPPGVDVVAEIQPGLPRVFIDPARVVQSLNGVISTAVRFTDKGTVQVRATWPSGADRVRIDIETTGRAVPAGERERIFEAFKFSDKARRHGSLGLGLSLARSIVELHQGSIEVDTLQGGGMVFHVWLPLPPDAIPRPSWRPPR
jgi:signal transduction histidine kinase